MPIAQIRNPETPEVLAPDFPICWVPIYQEELAAPGTFTINPPIPDTYRNLALFCQLRSVETNGVEFDYVGLRFNNDVGANYDWVYKQGSGAGVFAGGGAVAANWIQIALIEGANSRAANYSPLIIWIQGYKFADRDKWAYSSSNGALGDRSGVADLYIADWRGAWRSLNPVTRIDLWALNGTNFTADSRVELYGIL